MYEASLLPWSDVPGKRHSTWRCMTCSKTARDGVRYSASFGEDSICFIDFLSCFQCSFQVFIVLRRIGQDTRHYFPQLRNRYASLFFTLLYYARHSRLCTLCSRIPFQYFLMIYQEWSKRLGYLSSCISYHFLCQWFHAY